MNQFYKAVELLRQRLQGNPNVNTVIFARTEDEDLYKKNIFPLAHIVPTGADVSSQICSFTFEIAVLDQRDLSKHTVTSKFEGNDDIQDNLNVTYAVLNDLTTWLSTQNNDDNIEMTSKSGINPVLFSRHNLLDGWFISVTISVPNTISVC